MGESERGGGRGDEEKTEKMIKDLELKGNRMRQTGRCSAKPGI